jgi:hypothetical protein
MTTPKLVTIELTETYTETILDRTSKGNGAVPRSSVSLLTYTTKMPGPSWSLPSGKACPRAVYGDNTICGDCYADKGCYQYRTTENAQEMRFKWTVRCMRTIEGHQEFIRVMLVAIDKSQCDYFRVRDSGDMFNPAYANCWYEICFARPNVRFWIPTRSWQQPSGLLPVLDPLMATMRKLATLPNVTVRPSALRFGDYAPVVAGLHAGTTSDNLDVFRTRQCPAPSQDGECRDCRTCWNVKDLPVSYRRH